MQIMIKLPCSIFMFSSNFFINFYFRTQKCLKIHQLNVIKIIKKDSKKNLVKDIKVFLKKKRPQYGCER